MLVKITSGNVDTYPYSVGKLRRDNPNTSFPKSIPDATLHSYGVYRVSFDPVPAYSERSQKISQQTAPVNSGGNWVVGWNVESKTAAEIADYDSQMAENNRGKRDNLLSLSDWTQMNDSPLDTAGKTSWSTYRQALRDITAHANWPNLADADWPTKPA